MINMHWYKKITLTLSNLIQHYCLSNQLDHVLDIGCGSGQLSRLLLQKTNVQRLYLNDLYPQIMMHCGDFDLNSVEFYIDDIERLDLAVCFDLIMSSSALQWVIDLNQLFSKIAAHLKPQGLLCFSTFGVDNLTEIKQLTGQGLHYHSAATIQAYLSNHGFEILHFSEAFECLSFDHPKQVLQHLKATGVTATATDFKWSKTTLHQFYHDYERFVSIDGEGQRLYPLTYHPIYCIARSIV